MLLIEVSQWFDGGTLTGPAKARNLINPRQKRATASLQMVTKTVWRPGHNSSYMPAVRTTISKREEKAGRLGLGVATNRADSLPSSMGQA